jgi:hypothetical protein
MTLKELKKIIAEEYRYWVAEQPNGNGGNLPDMPMPDMPGIEMDPSTDIDPDGPGGVEDAEATLKDIFNMLKDFFEGDGEPTPTPPKPEGGKKDDDKEDDKEGDKKDDKEGDKKDDKETNESKRRKMNKALKILENKGILKNRKAKNRKGLKPKLTKSPLVERFKKLANIIK